MKECNNFLQKIIKSFPFHEYYLSTYLCSCHILLQLIFETGEIYILYIQKSILRNKCSSFWEKSLASKTTTTKKAEKKLLPNDLELSNLARNQIKKFSPTKIFSTLKARPILILHIKWPFLLWGFICKYQRQLLLEYPPYNLFRNSKILYYTV